MADAADVKPGDKVSWSWGAGQPAGTAAEVKTDTVTMETARGNEVKKDGEPGDPAVRVERSGHDVVKKASELEVEKPGPEHSGGEKKDEGEKQDGVTQNDDGKDVSAAGKPDSDTKTGHAEQKQEKKEEEKQDSANDSSAPTNGTEEKHEEKKSKDTSSAPSSAPNGEKKKPKPAAEAKAKPGKKAKAPPQPKAEKKKRKAATESGEPRRSKRIRGD